MTINHPQAGDIAGLRLLWQEAFGDSDSFLDGFFRTGFHPERCRLILQNGEPAAALYWFDCWLGGEKLAYIYAVATAKAYRGQGLCSRLMADTHRLLQERGYSAAVLVPGNRKLFTLYEKLGYKTFCPMELREVAAGKKKLPFRAVSFEAYNRLRRQLLPERGILQESSAPYLATFTDFYAGEGFLACLSREDDTLYFQEYLGDPRLLPGLVAALSARKASLRLPGGRDYAMYYPLKATDLSHAYLGISLG